VLPTNHTTAGSASGASGAGPNGGNGPWGRRPGPPAAAAATSAEGGAGGLVEVQPRDDPNSCYRSVGMGGAPGSSFVTSRF
jgi:hypothetical protein